MDMDLALSLGFTLLFTGISMACGYFGARPPRLDKIRMIPWRFLMLLSATAAIFALAHIANHFGLLKEPLGFVPVRTN